MPGSGSYLIQLPLISRHITDGLWNDWDPNYPPTEYIELADEKQTIERPDQWIKPDQYCPHGFVQLNTTRSIVVQVKAAQVAPTG
jgi:hypothetical protein